MEQASLYRKASVERVQSPERLNEYLRVTNPSVWVLLAAVIVLLAGLLVWSAFTSIGSAAHGIAAVENGVMTLSFDDASLAQNVEAGMKVSVGESESIIRSVGRRPDGSVFAEAETRLPDGSYEWGVQAVDGRRTGSKFAKGNFTIVANGIQERQMAETAQSVARYNVAGQQVSARMKGVQIEKLADGTIRKVVNK